jgi:hypothetical protein
MKIEKQNATSSGGVFCLSNHLVTDNNFQFFDGLSEFGVFFFLLLEQLQNQDIFTELIREMDSVFLPLLDEVGKFFFANKGNNRTAQYFVKPATLPKGKEDPVQVFFFLLRLADTNEAIRAGLGKWLSAVESFA